MENIDLIILTTVVVIAFIVFIVASVKEFLKMEKEEYVYNSKPKKFGRDALYDVVERLFDDARESKEEKARIIKTLDRTISDMEFDGVYFSDEVKAKLEREREELFCEYSGLPSVKAYDVNQI